MDEMNLDVIPPYQIASKVGEIEKVHIILTTSILCACALELFMYSLI